MRRPAAGMPTAGKRRGQRWEDNPDIDFPVSTGRHPQRTPRITGATAAKESRVERRAGPDPNPWCRAAGRAQADSPAARGGGVRGPTSRRRPAAAAWSWSLAPDRNEKRRSVIVRKREKWRTKTNYEKRMIIRNNNLSYIILILSSYTISYH